MYKRVLLKLSGEALAGNQGKGFDPETLKDLEIHLSSKEEDTPFSPSIAFTTLMFSNVSCINALTVPSFSKVSR